MIIPSIDLEGGRAVKRIQGRRGQYIFKGDYRELARRFQKAPLVHVVDLDGAERGRPVHIREVAEISQLLQGRCQLGGGLRDINAIQTALTYCRYAVVGSLPFKRPEIFAEAARLYGERIAVSIDYARGLVLTDGWTAPAAPVEEAVRYLARFAPFAAVVVTSVDVEGTGQGAKIDVDTRALRQLAPRLYYAGGVRDCGDVEKALEAGFDGVIVGYALYAGDLKKCAEF